MSRTKATQAVQSRLNCEQIILLKEIAKRKGISLGLLIRIIKISYLEAKNAK
jgi:hypothetical protein